MFSFEENRCYLKLEIPGSGELIHFKLPQSEFNQLNLLCQYDTHFHALISLVINLFKESFQNPLVFFQSLHEHYKDHLKPFVAEKEINQFYFDVFHQYRPDLSDVRNFKSNKECLIGRIWQITEKHG